MTTVLSPANLNRVTQMNRIHGFFSILEVGDVKVGECVIHKPVHGTVGAVHVLVDHPGNEV